MRHALRKANGHLRLGLSTRASQQQDSPFAYFKSCSGVKARYKQNWKLFYNEEGSLAVLRQMPFPVASELGIEQERLG